MSSVQRSQQGDYHRRRDDYTPNCKAALAYAAKGIPIFPLKPGGKTPLTERGFKDATTSQDRIRHWWSRWPDANIGIPTGKRSGLLVVDVDPDRGGYYSLADLYHQGHELPETTMVWTGGNGQHHYVKYPDDEEIRNSAGVLGPGLDVRGEGGYVVAPPSTTTGPYTFKKKLPLAKPPEWLREALRRPSRSSGEDVESVSPIRMNVSVEGDPIPKGERNTTLFKIACILRAKGQDQAAIMEALERTNRSRCSHLLNGSELEKIAKSAVRYAPGNASPEVSPEVLEALDELEADIMRRDWPGIGGKSERDVMIALIRVARMYGITIPVGVRVSIDIRTVALMASVSKRALLDNRKKGEHVPGIISRLKAKGWIRSDNAARSSRDAGAFVLLTPRAELHHSTTFRVSIEPEHSCGATLRAPLSAPRLRWSRPVYQGLTRVGTISRLGKTKGEIIDHLEAAGGSLSVEVLAYRLAGENGKRPRIRDLRRRHLKPLEENCVVDCSDDVVSLTPDWLDALNRRREEGGEIVDYRRDMSRYEREREAYRNRNKRTPDAHPANDRADGYISELEKLPPSPATEDLYPLVGRMVQTCYGPGELWQVFSDQVGVVLDSEPGIVTFMNPSELVLPEVAA